jgi:hypothetical protein
LTKTPKSWNKCRGLIGRNNKGIQLLLEEELIRQKMLESSLVYVVITLPKTKKGKYTAVTEANNKECA